MLLYFLHFLMCYALAEQEALKGNDEEMHIFSYAPPEKYGDANGDGFRSDNNEIDVGNLPQNITVEEYTFTFYNWNHRSGVAISEFNSTDYLKSIFKSNLETKFVVHGWLSSSDAYIVNNTIKVYLAERELNLVAVDWRTLAGYKMYPVTTYSVAAVGRGVAGLVLRLLGAGVARAERLHLIGHSLGAHVMGMAAHRVFQATKAKVARVTGLDPASPLYEYLAGFESRLDPGDAEFVDVIHTSGGAAGYYTPLGHADFYPNGGTPVQPACKELSLSAIGCSHGMAYRYYDESIENPKAFLAVECPDWSSFTNGSCRGNYTYMGDLTPPSTRGVYYLTTNDSPPYGRGDKGSSGLS